MNQENLHTLIDRYEEAYYTVVNNQENNEIFKWRAVEQFRRVWFAEDAVRRPFSEMFKEARKESSLLIDNAFVSPTSGVIKLAEKEPHEVERLFREVLFAEDGGDIRLRGQRVDEFLDGMERLRVRHFPRYYKYKQDRHAASCYLAFFAPEENYIYRHSEADMFARYMEFGREIGVGGDFRLEVYYDMCDRVVDALREHPTLIERYEHLLDETCYPDRSLHILAFDLIYCARTYGFYAGLSHASREESRAVYRLAELRLREEREKEERYQALLQERDRLERELEPYLELSLAGVEITSARYGVGVVLRHSGKQHNLITVGFPSGERQFRLHRDVWPMMRPVFEDDEEIIGYMTAYEEIWTKLKNVRNHIEKHT